MPSYFANYLFDGHHLHHRAALHTDSDGRILSVETNLPAGSMAYQGLLMPGMINTHCHLELSHMRGRIPPHTGLVNFLLQVVRGRSTEDEATIQDAMEQAEQSMQQQGIVAVGDISNTSHSAGVKAKKRLNYHTFVEVFGLREDKANEYYQHGLSVWSAFPHRSSLVLHAPYSISDALIQYIDQENAQRIGSIHNQECAEENELFQYGQGAFLELRRLLAPEEQVRPLGLRSLPAYFPKLTHTRHLILVHNTFSNETDIRLALDSGKSLFWCLCPHANRYIENTLPDAPLLHRLGCRITLGTDSLSSNEHLSIWREMKELHEAYPEIPLEEKLRWATLNGATALNMDQQLGSFDPGKQPGIVHIPDFDPDQALTAMPHMALLAPAAVL